MRGKPRYQGTRAPDLQVTHIAITLFTKNRGPLTKTIALDAAGTPKSDGGACRMARGRAERRLLDGVADLATLIEGLNSRQAIGLGALRADLPDEVAIVSKTELTRITDRTGVAARTAEYVVYREGEPAFLLYDHDPKGMPADVAARVAASGGFWPTMVEVFPDLANAARLVRRSTSAGLFRADTGERFEGSNGIHVYVEATDGADVSSALKAAPMNASASRIMAGCSPGAPGRRSNIRSSIALSAGPRGSSSRGRRSSRRR